MGGESGGVADARPALDDPDPNRDVSQQDGTDADEDVGAKPRRLCLDLTLEPDRAAEDYGERELSEEVEAKGVGEVGPRDIRGGCGERQ